MTPIERQILINQRLIMESLACLLDNEDLEFRLGKESANTFNLFYKKEEGYGFKIPFGCAKNPSKEGKLCGDGDYLCDRCKEIKFAKSKQDGDKE